MNSNSENYERDFLDGILEEVIHLDKEIRNKEYIKTFSLYNVGDDNNKIFKEYNNLATRFKTNGILKNISLSGKYPFYSLDITIVPESFINYHSKRCNTHNLQQESSYIELADKETTKNNEIETITFIRKDTPPKPTYEFYINGDINNVKKLRNDSSRLKKLANIGNKEKEKFSKALYDYVNTNINCAIYCGKKYSLTKVIEQHGDYFKVCHSKKVEVISYSTYIRRKKSEKIT